MLHVFNSLTNLKIGAGIHKKGGPTFVLTHVYQKHSAFYVTFVWKIPLSSGDCAAPYSLYAADELPVSLSNFAVPLM